jgi:hypothetical protein
MMAAAIRAAVMTAGVETAVMTSAGVVMMTMVGMVIAAGIRAVRTSEYPGPKPAVGGSSRRLAAVPL